MIRTVEPRAWSSDRSDAATAYALDRRRLLGLAAGGGAALAAARLHLGAPLASASAPASAPAFASARQATTGDPSTWRTWHLASADELRPAAPEAPTAAEADELLDLQAKRMDKPETAALVRRWGSGPAVLAWAEEGLALTDEFGFPGPRDARAQALLRTAMYDAVLAALDAQDAHGRPAPAAAESTLEPMAGVVTDRPSFPSEHAAVAGAAAAVFAELFPEAEVGRFAAMAEEAAESRLWAGANYRSDVEAGLALGRAVGERAVAHGKDDASVEEWDDSDRPTGPGYWVPTPPALIDPPVEPLAGTWQAWVLPSNDAVRPAPPPAYGTPLWRAELEAVQEATRNRTLEQERIVDYWANKGPQGAYTDFALDLIERDGLDTAHAARVLALTSVAQADALIAVWDAKFTFWTSRPITEDPDLDMLLPSPPYPAYPSGFSASAGAAAAVLAHLFPRAEVDLLSSAAEAAIQRCWSGIHYPIDDDAGLQMGYQTGRLVSAVARQDGAA